MTDRQKSFLIQLSKLCKEYSAAFEYTVDDDGIHISVDGEEIFVGFLFDVDAAEILINTVTHNS